MFHVDTDTSLSFSSSFPLTENPLSSVLWLNGLTDGVDWQNMRSTPGLAFGTQSGNSGTFDDSTAILKGAWLQNTTITTTCHSINQQGGNCYCEVEHRHRSSLSAHVNRGYEVNCRATHGMGGAGAAYTEIVRWDGPLGGFVMLSHIDEGEGNFTGLHDGDIMKSTFIGTVITTYLNYGAGFVVVNTYDTAPDVTKWTGNPGIGHWLHLNGATGVSDSDYGFTNLTITAS